MAKFTIASIQEIILVFKQGRITPETFKAYTESFDDDGFTPLTFAAGVSNGFLVITDLIDCGANVNREDNRKRTPIERATANGLNMTLLNRNHDLIIEDRLIADAQKAGLKQSVEKLQIIRASSSSTNVASTPQTPSRTRSITIDSGSGAGTAAGFSPRFAFGSSASSSSVSLSGSPADSVSSSPSTSSSSVITSPTFGK